MATLMTNLDKVREQAIDLRTRFPRSPRALLGGYVIAARCVDKCRAQLVGWQGEYHYACPLDQLFLAFTHITPEDLLAFVATGATDDEVDAWIRRHALTRRPIEIARFNNHWRERRLSQLDDDLQVYMEQYLTDHCPPDVRVYTWFDVYDAEEGRLRAAA